MPLFQSLGSCRMLGFFRLPRVSTFSERSMWRFPLAYCLFGLTVMALGSADNQPKLPPAAPGTIDFQRDIQPIFAKNCISCHGPAKQKGGLRLDDGAEALKGGNSGPVIKPGDSFNSRLLLLVACFDHDLRCSPADKKPQNKQVIGTPRAWIGQA